MSRHIGPTWLQTYHLRYSGYVVVATAYETDKCLPGILVEDADAGKRGRVLAKVRVQFRPLSVQRLQVDPQAEIMPEKRLGIVTERYGFPSLALGRDHVLGPVDSVVEMR